jgi:hypothetical protein
MSSIVNTDDVFDGSRSDRIRFFNVSTAESKLTLVVSGRVNSKPVMAWKETAQIAKVLKTLSFVATNINTAPIL